MSEVHKTVHLKSEIVLHKYLNDKQKIVHLLKIFPWCCTEFPNDAKFSMLTKIAQYYRFVGTLFYNKLLWKNHLIKDNEQINRPFLFI